MKLTKSEIKNARTKAPPSHLLMDMIWVFAGRHDLYHRTGRFQFLRFSGYESQTDTAASTAITMVFLGALLTGCKLYDKIAKHAGAGTLVPITGFANAIVSPANGIQK